MQDILGNELAVGDLVVAIQSRYRELDIYRVAKINKCYITLRDENHKLRIVCPVNCVKVPSNETN